MGWLGDHLWAVWIVLAGLLAGAELASLDLVLLMLAVGALAGGLTAGVGLGLPVQIVVAAAASLGMLTLVRPPVVKRLHNGPTLLQGTDKLIGRQGVVTAEITPHETGRVRLQGDVWSASPYDPDLTIPAGTTVEVLQIRGATAFVHPVGVLGGD